MQLVNTGGALLTTTCMNNVPSRCEIIVARAPLLFADDDDTCNVCDESGISIVGSDITDDTFITSSRRVITQEFYSCYPPMITITSAHQVMTFVSCSV